MSSVVHDLQKAIVDGKESLTQLLRKTKLIAAKLNLKDVEEWVDLELNGYPKSKERPAYRLVTTDRLLVHNPYRGWEYVGDVKQTIWTHQPIAEIERLAQDEEVSFTPDKKFAIRDILGGATGSLWPQRVTLNAGQFKGVLEAVKNELLQWAIELEKRGVKGQDMTFDEKEKQSAATIVFHNTFLGDNARVNYSSTDASINAVGSGDLFSALQTAIERHVEDDDLKRQLLLKATELKTTVGKESFAKTYSEFIGLSTHHLSLFAPLVQELTRLIKA